MNHILHPTNSYLYYSGKAPILENNTSLIVFHYINSPECTRWTERSRDIRRKNAKKLNYDMSEGYIVSEKHLKDIEFKCETGNSKVLFLGYKLYGDKWVEGVYSINLAEISFIEIY